MNKEELLALLRDMRSRCEEAIRQLNPEDLAGKCTCHERDSSQVCDLCYHEGYRGWMQEDGSTKCKKCGLWSDSDECEFC